VFYNRSVTTIQVSGHVKAELDELKEQEEHTSYDSVHRALLHDYNNDA